MPRDTNEPQSYGSSDDWVTGATDQEVNDQKSPPPAEHRHFYESRHEAETSAPHQGGKTSPVQLADTTGENGAAGPDDNVPSTAKVTTQGGGSKRDSYFKHRDYE